MAYQSTNIIEIWKELATLTVDSCNELNNGLQEQTLRLDVIYKNLLQTAQKDSSNYLPDIKISKKVSKEKNGQTVDLFSAEPFQQPAVPPIRRTKRQASIMATDKMKSTRESATISSGSSTRASRVRALSTFMDIAPIDCPKANSTFVADKKIMENIEECLSPLIVSPKIDPTKKASNLNKTYIMPIKPSTINESVENYNSITANVGSKKKSSESQMKNKRREKLEDIDVNIEEQPSQHMTRTMKRKLQEENQIVAKKTNAVFVPLEKQISTPLKPSEDVLPTVHQVREKEAEKRKELYLKSKADQRKLDHHLKVAKQKEEQTKRLQERIQKTAEEKRKKEEKQKERGLPMLVLVVLTAVVIVFADRLQCKDPEGQSVDWFTAIKLPKLKPEESDGTSYVYMDARQRRWTHLTGITTEDSAVGHTVSQMNAPTESYNNSIMWVVYNDEPTNRDMTSSMGHSKGTVVADNRTGFWLVHSVPKFPYLPYQKDNKYAYPETGVKYGQSFLCVSMEADELDKVGDQLINNEVLVYGSHFGAGLETKYPSVYNATLPRGRSDDENDGVRLQYLQSIDGFKFLSISKNRHFGKDLYEDLITNLTHSNLYTETWLNSRDSFNSSCSEQYKTMNIKSITMNSIKGLENVSYNSSKDHSKWVITGSKSVPWSCIGDINRAHEQTERGGGTVCIDSITIWSQYKKLILDIEMCDI